MRRPCSSNGLHRKRPLNSPQSGSLELSSLAPVLHPNHTVRLRARQPLSCPLSCVCPQVLSFSDYNSLNHSFQESMLKLAFNKLVSFL